MFFLTHEQEQNTNSLNEKTIARNEEILFHILNYGYGQL